MSLPRDILDRLNAIGEDAGRYERMMSSEGEQFLRGYVTSLERRASLYHKWSPVLRDFAAECRRRQPCPDPESVSARDRAKLPIYETMVREAERLPHMSGNASVIFSLPLPAIPIAQSLWPGEDIRGVFLTRDELEEWGEIYKHPEDAFSVVHSLLVGRRGSTLTVSPGV